MVNQEYFGGKKDQPQNGAAGRPAKETKKSLPSRNLPLVKVGPRPQTAQPAAARPVGLEAPVRSCGEMRMGWGWFCGGRGR